MVRTEFEFGWLLSRAIPTGEKRCRGTRHLPEQQGATFFRPKIEVGEGAIWVGGDFGICCLPPGQATTRRCVSLAFIGEMTVGLRAIWLAGNNRLIGFDPATLARDVQTRYLEDERAGSASLTTAGGSLWLGAGHQLLEFDPHTGDVRRQFDLKDVFPDKMVSNGRDLWIVDSLQRTVFRFSPVRGRLTGKVVLDVTPESVAVDRNGALWIINRAAGTLTRIDPSVASDPPAHVGSAPTDVAIGNDSIWISDAGTGTIKEIDPVLREVVRTIPVPGEPSSLAVDPSTGDVWVYLE